MVYAFKENVSVIDDTAMNSLLSLQDFYVLYDGTLVDSKTGSGVTENSLATYYRCARFTLTGVTALTRIELELDKDGNGADLVVQIRSGMDPTAGTEGTVLKEVIVPAEFIPNGAAYWSIPINLTGLTSGGTYWIVVGKAGDTTNKNDWIGEASADASYPCYKRSGTSGAWTAGNALHLKIYSGNTGRVKHGIQGTNKITTVTRDVNNKITTIYSYLPPSDGSAGGIRNIMTVTRSGGIIVSGVVS